MGSALAERSPPSLLGYLTRLPSSERPAAAESGYRVLAERGFAEAKASLAGLPDAATRDAARLALASVLARTDARGAEALTQGMDEKVRARALRQIALHWPLDDVRGLLRWVDGLGLADADLRVQLINGLGFRLAINRPDQAIAVLPMFPDEARPELCGMLARRFSRSDLAKGLAWMVTLTEQADRSAAMLGLAEAWAASDPETARAAVSDWPDPAVRPRLHGLVASGWASRDPGAALAWAMTLPPALREDAASKALAQLAVADAAGGQRALLRLPPGAERDRLAERFVTSQPGSRELADWAAGYPEPATARKMTRRAVFGWCLGLEDDELGEAESWALALPEGALRDEALAGALDGSVRLIQARNGKLAPDGFVRLVGSIGAEPLRREQARRLAELWRRAFPDDQRRPFARLLGEEPPR